jgi:hypothetical protein
MGIWSRILGNGKATLNSPIRKLKGFFRPATDEYFDDPDVVAIYYRALKRKQEFAVLTEYTRYLRDRQDILSGGLSPSELIYNNDLDSDSRDFNKRPRRKQRGIVTLFLTFHTPQGAGNLPVILLKVI